MTMLDSLWSNSSGPSRSGGGAKSYPSKPQKALDVMDSLERDVRRLVRMFEMFYDRRRLSELEGFSWKVRAVLRIMEESYSEPISLTCIADALSIHPVSLRQKISCEFSEQGIYFTPASYLTAIRMRAARHLLRSQPLLECKEVAAAVGLSARQLRRLFEKYMCTTPVRYRSRALSTEIPRPRP